MKNALNLETKTAMNLIQFLEGKYLSGSREYIQLIDIAWAIGGSPNSIKLPLRRLASVGLIEGKKGRLGGFKFNPDSSHATVEDVLSALGCVAQKPSGDKRLSDKLLQLIYAIGKITLGELLNEGDATTYGVSVNAKESGTIRGHGVSESL